MYTVEDVVNFIIEEELNIKHTGEIVCIARSENREVYYTIKDCETGVYYYEVKDKHILKNKETKKEMKKSDLKNRMIVEMRNGIRYLVVDDYLLNVDGTGFMNLSSYTDDLMNKSKSIDSANEEINRKYDIMKIYNRTAQWNILSERDLIWERKKSEPVEMSFDEIQKILGIDNLKIKMSLKDLVFRS